jgi:hypothetical protein
MRLKLYSVILLLLSLSAGWGQISLPYTLDPASQGMGGINLPGLSYFQPYGNPACLANLRTSGVSIYSAQPFGLAELSANHLTGWFNSGGSGAAASIGYSGFGGYRQIAIQAAFGQRLWQRLDVGLSLEGQFSQFSDYGNTASYGFTVGLGLPLTDQLQMGLIVRNPVSYSGNEGYQLPQIMVVSFAYTLSKELLLAGEWFQEVGQKPDIKFGIAYYPIRVLPVRIGFNSVTSSFFIGSGYIWHEKIYLNFAAGYHPFLGFSPTLGVYYKFNRK